MPALTNRESAINWLETERLNLVCGAEIAAGAGMADAVTGLFRLLHGYLEAEGYDDAKRLRALAAEFHSAAS